MQTLPSGREIVKFIFRSDECGWRSQSWANADYGKRRREVNSTEPEWRFAQPTAVVYDDKNGRLIVADTQRSRFQIYDKQATYMVPQLNL